MTLARNQLVTAQFVCMHVAKSLRGKTAKMPPKAAAARGNLLVDLVQLSGEGSDAVAVVAGDLLKNAAPEARAAGMSILKILKDKVNSGNFKDFADLALKEVRQNQRETLENEFLPQGQRFPQAPILSARVSVDGRCQFCGLKDGAFALDGAALDGHYLSACPALEECGRCGQIVEKAGLAEHAKFECNSVSGQVLKQ
jgi:hypothetical protein